VIPSEFFFVVTRQQGALRQLGSQGVVLHVDSELRYEPFCADFGPLNAAQTYRFCARANAALQVSAHVLGTGGLCTAVAATRHWQRHSSHRTGGHMRCQPRAQPPGT
jgi:Dual specificity protein phosphatase, N-terminal half